MLAREMRLSVNLGKEVFVSTHFTKEMILCANSAGQIRSFVNFA
jgi:hypothetical protein